MEKENKISEIFGKPEEGVHAPTIPIINLAAVDTIGTVLIAYGISWYWDKPFIPVFVGTFAVGEIAHLAFGVETRFIKMIKKQNN
jgi:hypothetical protein